MRNAVPTCLKALTFIVLLCLSSCQTAPPIAEAPKPPAKDSPAQERYKKNVEDRLGPLWYRLVNPNTKNLWAGTVDTTFEIFASGGKARNLTVTSNTGGPMDELIARKAIDQLRAPPVPSEILALLHRDYMVLEESFTIYETGNANPSPTPSKERWQVLKR
jgi:hypothetical protein